MKSIRYALAVSLVAIAASGPAMAQMFYMTTDHNMRASKLIGMPVLNERHEKIGTIDEIMLPAAGGEAIVVVSVGGFLGIGEKMIKVPVSKVRLSDGTPVMVNGAKAALMGMPKYSYGFGGGGG